MMIRDKHKQKQMQYEKQQPLSAERMKKQQQRNNNKRQT